MQSYNHLAKVIVNINNYFHEKQVLVILNLRIQTEQYAHIYKNYRTL